MKDTEDLYRVCRDMMKDAVRSRKMGWLSRGTVERAVSQGDLLWIEEGGEILAFAILRDLKRSPIISLDKICVSPEHRNRGHGANLLHQAILRASFSRRTLRVDVVATNTAAKRFYLRHGFVPSTSRHLGNGTILVETLHLNPSSSPDAPQGD